MSSQSTFTLINPKNGSLFLKLFSFEDNSHFDHLQRNNYYSLIWVAKGSGKLRSDFSEYEFVQDNLFAFSPYQPFMFAADGQLTGIALQFHPDFFCIHLHQKEVACNGVLFNNIYYPPFTFLDAASSKILMNLTEQMKSEMQNLALAHVDLLVSYLKILLINASRAKTEQQPTAILSISNRKQPFVLQHLRDAIEKDFRTSHSPGDYSKRLNISGKALAKITKTHFNKTLKELIGERIIIEAKRELYLTDKPIKQIAYELGFDDEYYFSRFFKRSADVSPQMYRNSVGFGRGIN